MIESTIGEFFLKLNIRYGMCVFSFITMWQYAIISGQWWCKNVSRIIQTTKVWLTILLLFERRGFLHVCVLNNKNSKHVIRFWLNWFGLFKDG
jgi:hypothetical protein